MPRFLLPTVFASLATLCGCSSDYEVSRQEVCLRLRAKEDALSILEVQSGITAGKDEAEALNALGAVLAGAKRYPPERGFLSLDLDAEDIDTTIESETERAAFREFAANVNVSETHVFLDDRGQLCFARHTRIERLHRMLEIVNAWLNRNLLEDHAREDAGQREPSADFPVFDAETRASIRAAATAGHAWLSLRDDALVLDVPMSEANAARCLAAVAGGKLDEFESQLLAQASSLSLCAGHALLRFGEPSHPLVRFESDLKQAPTEAQVDERLLIDLRNSGCLILKAPDLARMRREFEVPAPPDTSPK